MTAAYFSVQLGLTAWRLTCLGVVLLVLYAGAGFALAPRLLRSSDLATARAAALQTRQRLDEHSVYLGDRLEMLIGDADRLQARLAKAYLAYTLDGGGSSGQTSAAVEIELAAAASSAGNPRGGTEGVRVRLSSLVESAGRLVVVIEAIEADLAAEVIAAIPALSPLSGPGFVLTSGLGFRRNPATELEEYHAGIDLAAARGTPIYAPADGRVIFIGPFQPSRRNSWWRLGRVVALYSGGRFVTVFGHLSKILVDRGERVERGDLLAEVGDSGWTPSPHLHYGIWRRSEAGFIPVEPRLYMLDQPWPDDAELLGRARDPVPEGKYDPMPRAFRIR